MYYKYLYIKYIFRSIERVQEGSVWKNYYYVKKKKKMIYEKKIQLQIQMQIRTTEKEVFGNDRIDSKIFIT